MFGRLVLVLLNYFERGPVADEGLEFSKFNSPSLKGWQAEPDGVAIFHPFFLRISVWLPHKRGLKVTDDFEVFIKLQTH